MKEKPFYEQPKEQQQQHTIKAAHNICKKLGIPSAEIDSFQSSLIQEWSLTTLTQFNRSLAQMALWNQTFANHNDNAIEAITTLEQHYNVVLPDKDKFQEFIQKVCVIYKDQLVFGTTDSTFCLNLLKTYGDQIVSLDPVNIAEHKKLDKQFSEIITTEDAKKEAYDLYKQLKEFLSHNVSQGKQIFVLAGENHHLPSIYLAKQLLLHIAGELNIKHVVIEYGVQEWEDLEGRSQYDSKAPVAMGTIKQNNHIHIAQFIDTIKGLNMRVVPGDVELEEKMRTVFPLHEQAETSIDKAFIEKAKEIVLTSRNISIVAAIPENVSSLGIVGASHMYGIDQLIPHMNKAFINLSSLSLLAEITLYEHKRKNTIEYQVHEKEYSFPEKCYSPKKTKDLDRLSPYQVKACVDYVLAQEQELKQTVEVIKEEVQPALRPAPAAAIDPAPAVSQPIQNRASRLGPGCFL